MKLPVDKMGSSFVIILFLLLVTFEDLKAQKKFSFEMNIGLLHSVGKDEYKIYQSKQPLSIQYASKKKYDNPYLSFLPNVMYVVRKNLVLGLQTGIYAHFKEQYSGYDIPVMVTVPLLLTGRLNIPNVKENKLGISVSGGKNFFNMKTYPYNVKNGWLVNGSIFFLIKQNNFFKLGIEKQVDNGYVYYTSTSPFTKDEMFKYNFRRTAVMVSYGFKLKSF